MMKSPLPEWHPISTSVIITPCDNNRTSEPEYEPEYEPEFTEHEAYLYGLTDYGSW